MANTGRLTRTVVLDEEKKTETVTVTLDGKSYTYTRHFANVNPEITAKSWARFQNTAAEWLLAEYDRGISTPMALEAYELYKYPRFDPKTGKELPPLPRPTRGELVTFYRELKRKTPLCFALMIENGSIPEEFADV